MIEIDPSLILKYDNHIYYHGEKYQKVEEPKSFYDNSGKNLGRKLDMVLIVMNSLIELWI